MVAWRFSTGISRDGALIVDSQEPISSPQERLCIGISAGYVGRVGSGRQLFSHRSIMRLLA